MSHKVYGGNFLEEGEPPFRHQGLARRQEAAVLMRTTRILHLPILLDPGEHVRKFDVILYLPR